MIEKVIRVHGEIPLFVGVPASSLTGAESDIQGDRHHCEKLESQLSSPRGHVTVVDLLFRPGSAGLFPLKRHHTFQMPRLGKQVEGLNLRDRVVILHLLQIADLGGGIAADVDDALWSKGEQLL